jgi:hypothetical protein
VASHGREKLQVPKEGGIFLLGEPKEGEGPLQGGDGHRPEGINIFAKRV